MPAITLVYWLCLFFVLFSIKKHLFIVHFLPLNHSKPRSLHISSPTPQNPALFNSYTSQSPSMTRSNDVRPSKPLSPRRKGPPPKKKLETLRKTTVLLCFSCYLCEKKQYFSYFKCFSCVIL